VTTDPNTVILAPTGTGDADYLVTGGTNVVGGFRFGNAANTGTIYFTNAASIYVGSQGITSNGAVTLAVALNNGGLFGATTNWTGLVPMSLAGGTFTFQTGDMFGNPYNITLSGVMSGAGNLNATGGGTLTLGAANTYSGNTLIDGGTLALGPNGSVAGSPRIIVGGGATFDVSPVAGFTLGGGQTLSGYGTVTGAVMAAASTIYPGSNGVTGTLTFTGTLTENGGVNNEFNLSSNPAGPNNDFINASGGLVLSGTNTILINGSSVTVGDAYPLISYVGGILTGDITNFTVASGTLSNSLAAQIIYYFPQKSVRGSTNITWIGNATANNWDTQTTTNWLDNTTAAPDYFVPGDSVLFNNQGAIYPVVNIVGSVAPATVIVDTTSNYTFKGTGTIAGTGGLLVSNATLTVLTTNLYSGPTIIAGGVLATPIIANSASPSGIGAASSSPGNLILNNGTLNYFGPTAATDHQITLTNAGGAIGVSNGATLTLNGVVYGSRLVVTGPGALVLASANNYTGGTIINNGGVVAPGTVTSFGTGPLTNNGGTLWLADFPASGIMANSFYVTGTSLIDMAGSGNAINLNGAWSGNGTIIVTNDTGSGSTLTFGGGTGGTMANFTGAINVVSTNSAGTGSAGNLRFNNTSSEVNNGSANASFNLGTGAINLQSRDSGEIDLGSLTGGPATSLDGNSGGGGTTLWSIGGLNTSTTFAGLIKDHAAGQFSAVTKVGAGTLILSGNNTYSGLTTISGGALQIGDGVTSGVGTLGTASVSNNSVLIFARPDAVTIGNVIGGTGSVVQSGSNVLTLSSANNYAGTTTASNNGTILIGTAGAIPNGTALTLGGDGTAGTLDLSGNTLAVGALNTEAGASGTAIGNSAATPATLVFNGTSSSVFSGSIQDSLSGGSSTVALTIQGGNLVLNGVNTYSGVTTINGGTLTVGAGGSLANTPAIILGSAASLLDVSAAGGFSLSGGEVLSGTGAVKGNLSAANAFFSPATNAVAGMLTFSNNLALDGGDMIVFDLSTTPASGNDRLVVAGELNLSGTNILQINPLGGTLVEGTYRLITFGSLGSGGAANFLLGGGVGNGVQAAISVTATEVDLVVSPGAGSSVVWQGDGSANLWDTVSTNWIFDGNLVAFGNGDFAIFNDTATNLAVNLTGLLQPGSIVVNSTNNYTFSGVGAISGSLALNKTNSGTLIVLTANNCDGVVTIGQGVVQLGDGATVGTLGNSSIVDNGLLLVQEPDGSVLDNSISGTGVVVQAGAGTLTLTASNTYTGGTTISTGTLQVGDGAWFGFGNISNSGTLAFNYLGNPVVGNVIGGTGNVVLFGSGTVTLNASNSYNGGTSVSNGMLQVDNLSGSGTGSGQVIVANGGALSGTGEIGGSVDIQGGGSLVSGYVNGSLTVDGDLSMGAGSILNVQPGANNNSIVVGGNLNLGGTLNVTNAAGLPDGSYSLFTYGGSLVSSLVLGATPAGRLYSINTNTPGEVDLVIAHVAGGGNGTGPAVTVTDNGSSITLANGIVSIVIWKSDAHISQMNYQGQNLLAGGSDGGEFYWSWNQPNYQNPVVSQYSLVQDPAGNGGTIAEVDLFSPWNGNVNDTNVAALDVDIHYFLRQGSQGFYASAIISHPASYPDNPGGEFRMVCYNGTTFDWLSEDAVHDRLMTPASTPWVSVPGAPKEFQLWTAGIYQGQYECKYEYSADYGDLNAWGFSSTSDNVGIWMTKPSQEYYSGGPMKRELICQDDQAGPGPILLNMINGTHYTMGSDTDIKAGEAFSKTFGPWLIYANSIPVGTTNAPAILKADAQAQAVVEQGAWPFTWWNNTNYVQNAGRGTVAGTIKIADSGNPNASPAGLWVGVAQAPPSSENSADFQLWEKNFQYWVKSDANGNFTIPNVIAGTNYTLFAFGPGASGTFQSKSLPGNSLSTVNLPVSPFTVTVTGGATTNLGTITWIPTRVGPTVWEIGVPDRSAHEFLHGTDWWLADTGSSPTDPSPNWMKSFDFPTDFPNGLIYIVGQSQWSTGWNFAHSALGTNASSTETWKVLFNLPQAPANGAAASLYMGFAADYQGPVKVVANGHTITSGVSPPSSSDDTMIRLGIHGVFSDVRLSVPASDLQAGQNEMDFTMTATGSNEKSAMYDYLRLELSSYIPPPPASLTATVNNSQVALNWTAMSGATSYTVRRAVGSNGPYAVIATNIIGPVVGSGSTNATYVDAAAPSGTNYYIIASVNPNGSTNSAPVSAVLATAAPPQIQISGVRMLNGILILNGGGGPAGQGYVVLTATNLSLPLTQWLPLATNSFDINGNFNSTNTTSVSAPQQFYLIQYKN
jgi:rhamnogalacturonan endolyase